MDQLAEILAYWPFVAGLVVAGVASGLIAGLLGVGGGIIMVPFLFLSFVSLGVAEGVAMKLAVASSLTTILVTSLSSARSHKAKGAVDFELLKAWSLPIFVGVVLGTLTGGFVDGRILTAVFAVVAFSVAVQMLWPKRQSTSPAGFPNRAARTFSGLVIGLISSLMGIGGGTLSVPILTYYGFDIRRAVGTASAIGFVIAIPGSIGYMIAGLNAPGLPFGSIGYVNLIAFAAFAPLTTLFAPLGSRLAHSIPRTALRYCFSVFLFATAASMAWKLVG